MMFCDECGAELPEVLRQIPCKGCRKQITRSRFDEHNGRCVRCTRRARLPLRLGYFLVFVGAFHILLGIFLIFSPFGQYSVGIFSKVGYIPLLAGVVMPPLAIVLINWGRRKGKWSLSQSLVDIWFLSASRPIHLEVWNNNVDSDIKVKREVGCVAPVPRSVVDQGVLVIYSLFRLLQLSL